MLKLTFREAVEDDLPELVKMLADDDLGSRREDSSTPLNARYLSAFNEIVADHNNQLIVAELGNDTVGMLQLTYIPYLTHTGSWRCLVEGVRVRRAARGQGIGTQLIQWAIEQAKNKGCLMIQLTSDKTRPDALEFYQSLGFRASHVGFKLALD